MDEISTIKNYFESLQRIIVRQIDIDKNLQIENENNKNKLSDKQNISVNEISSKAEKNIWEICLNRPSKRNALDETFWKELYSTINILSTSKHCRCILLTANGEYFSSGIDLNYVMSQVINEDDFTDAARRSLYIKGFIKNLQDTVSSFENCNKPIIACIDGGCIGAAIDIITACDIRICTQNAFFIVKEIDLAIAADIGTLQRLPKIVNNDSWVREICFTGRKVSAEEAFDKGLISYEFYNKDDMLKKAISLAITIASKSPNAIYGTKYALNFNRNHTIQEGLDMQALWNSAMLQTEDLQNAFQKTPFKDTQFVSKW